MIEKMLGRWLSRFFGWALKSKDKTDGCAADGVVAFDAEYFVIATGSMSLLDDLVLQHRIDHPRWELPTKLGYELMCKHVADGVVYSCGVFSSHAAAFEENKLLRLLTTSDSTLLTLSIRQVQVRKGYIFRDKLKQPKTVMRDRNR